MYILPVHVSVHHMLVVPREAKEGVRSPRIGVTNSFEPLFGWGLNPGLVKVLLQVSFAIKTFFSVPKSIFYMYICLHKCMYVYHTQQKTMEPL